MNELLKLWDEFVKATSLPDGPSLTMQRHNPTWEAFKNLCDEFAKMRKLNV